MSFFNLFRSRAKDQDGFDEPGNTACFTCDHVLEHKRPINYVVHDIEGDWQFLCGEEGHDESNIRIIALDQALQIDASVRLVASMPGGKSAKRRNTNEKWTIFEDPTQQG